jgi:hypothetical protein
VHRSVIAAVVVLVVAAAVGGSSRAAEGAAAACSTATYGSQGYGYAGFQANRPGHGVRAALTGLSDNAVAQGHVAAWVGVGGPGQGPNGSDMWLQVGLSSFAGAPGNLYYEVTRPGTSPVYNLIEPNVARGELRRVAVLEMSQRAGWWRVWVNGQPVSEPIHLPGSTKRWQPIATAESWDGGTGSCNAFSYRFERVEVAAGRGGSWRRFDRGYRFQDTGYRLSLLDAGSAAPQRAARAQASRSATSFVAASA